MSRLSLGGLLLGTWLLSAPCSSLAAAWRQEIVGSNGSSVASAVVLAANGDVISGGIVYGTPTGDLTVARYAAADGAELWRFTITNGHALSLALDGAGDVLAGGRIGSSFAVVKIDGTAGTEIWRSQTVNGNFATKVAVDGAGDVIATGDVEIAPLDHDIIVLKLAGATGAELWRHTFGGSEHQSEAAAAVVVDASGDAVAVGTVTNVGAGFLDFVVVKVAGATGAELWRRDIDGGSQDRGTAVAIHPSGDVVVAGRLGDDYLVARLAAATGADVWLHTLAGDGSGGNLANRGLAVTVDAAGDVVSGGVLVNAVTFNDLVVVKLAGASGTELWRRVIDGSRDAPDTDFAADVTVDGSGDVLAAGEITSSQAFGAFAVVKIAGASGALLWQQQINGFPPPDEDFANAIAVAANGDAVAAGRLKGIGTSAFSFATVKLSALDGAVGPVSGERVLVRDAPALDSRRVVLVSRDTAVVAAAPASAGDPTIGGATLTIQNPTTLETATVALPAAGWQGLGTPPGSSGYRYRDGAATFGPCRSALLRSGTLRVSCRGTMAAIAFSLDEATQGSVRVGLQAGSAASQCVTFGGTVSRDVGTGTESVGVFRARKAPAASGDCS